MKKFLVFLLVAVAVGVMVLIYTGKSVNDVIPLSSLKKWLPSRRSRNDRGIEGPSVQKFVLQDNTVNPTSPKESGQASTTVQASEPAANTSVENTQIAMVDATTDVTSGGPANPDERANELLADAKKLMREGKVGEAKLKLDRVQMLQCRGDLKREATKLSRNSVPLFEEVFAKEAEPLDGAKTFNLGSGGDIIGWISREDARSVSVKMEDGGEVILQREDIDKIVPVSPAERRANVMNEYYARKEKIEEDDALGHYDLAVFSRKKGLNKRAGTHLETALNLNSQVRKSVRDREAKNIYMLAVYFGSMGKSGKEKEYEARLKRDYSDSKYLAMLGEEIEMPEPQSVTPTPTGKHSGGSTREVPAVTGPPPKKMSGKSPQQSSPAPGVGHTPVPSSMGGSAGQWETEGNKYYKQGLELYRKSLPLLKSGSRSFDSVNRQALNAFQKSVDSYRKAKQSGKASANIDTKMAQANSLKYGCYKMARVR